MSVVVVDASVVIKWFVPENGTEAALQWTCPPGGTRVSCRLHELTTGGPPGTRRSACRYRTVIG